MFDLWLGAAVGFPLMLDGIHNDRNKQVQHHEGGNQDKGYKVEPRVGELLHHRSHDTHRPAFQGHYLKQGVEAGAEGAEPLGKGFAKQLGGNDRGNVEDQTKQRYDAAHAGQRGQQRLHHHQRREASSSQTGEQEPPKMPLDVAARVLGLSAEQIAGLQRPRGRGATRPRATAPPRNSQGARPLAAPRRSPTCR